MLKSIWYYIKDIPEYWPALIAGGSILVIGAPILLGLWYFLDQRKIRFPKRLQIASGGIFVMFAGLAFLFASPLATQIHGFLRVYLFITCLFAAYTIISLLDIFLIQHFLIEVKKVYISPPLRKIIIFVGCCIVMLPILRYVLRLNPFTLVAIPTIATAGVALAFQDTMKAFIAGVGLGHMIRVGDWVGFQDKEGRVLDINWGRTVLRTLDGDTLYVPNALLLTQPFINYTDNSAHRMALKISLAYSAPPEKVKKILVACTEKIPGISDFPAPTAQIQSFDASVAYTLFYWIEEYGNRSAIQDRLATRVWDALTKERLQIQFPFPTYSMDESFQPVHARKPPQNPAT